MVPTSAGIALARAARATTAPRMPHIASLSANSTRPPRGALLDDDVAELDPDIVEIWGLDSFPASDAPANW